MSKQITIIGSGIAGMEAAAKFSEMGYSVILIEKENKMGGHVSKWHNVFPDYKPAKEIISKLKSTLTKNIKVFYETEIENVVALDGKYYLQLSNSQNIESEVVLITTGFELFNASKKEEYGFGIYENVITSANLEEKFNSGRPIKTSRDATPKRVAFIHCVGSRDEKAGNKYCSKVCCANAVKLAIETKQLLPDAEIYSFYMDLRMFDRYFEDLYFEAQSKYGIRFIRGRLSEACENPDGTIILKAEDTLSGKPLKMTVDMAVLMVGFTSSVKTIDLAAKFGISVDNDKFIKPLDNHLNLNITNQPGIFVAGACTGPKSIAETLADARSAAIQVINYLQSN